MRKLQLTQMYSRLFWEKIKPVVDERWRRNLVLHPEAASEKGSLLAFRNDIIKEMWDDESEDVRAKVKRCRDEEVAEDAESDEDNAADSEGQRGQAKARSYQR